jgi:vacuolar-type H+-ATPase subunit H
VTAPPCFIVFINHEDGVISMADHDKDRTSSTSSGSASDAIGGTVSPGSSAAGSSGGIEDTGKISSDAMGSRGDDSSTVGSAARMADEAKREARHYADEMTGRAKEQGRTIFEQQKDAAARQVDSVAHAFRRTAEQMQNEGQAQTGPYVNMVAERLEGLGRQLRQKNMDALIGDAENLGRRAPGAFFAGSVVAGFLLARFLKSSSERREGMGMSESDSTLHSSYGGDRFQMSDAYGSMGEGMDSGESSTGFGSTMGEDSNPTGTSTLSPAQPESGGNPYGNR